ncbi:DUF6573 family protein [Streptomyces sp. NBC_00306]|uniref:DUF6573 family protein n=1 Tax=Streptomyces sp. NBC_00306 TaxID=2975708 RepID=UPI002E2A0175|nr:DUF6573 family protein [Streptomyces sp. NBC_00306]
MSDHTKDLLARIDDDLSVGPCAMRSVPFESTDSAPAASDDPATLRPLVAERQSRAEGIARGALFPVPEGIAREAGFMFPVALTRAAWLDCVAWTDEDSTRQTPQDQEGRLWDVLYMSASAARRGGSSRTEVELYRVPRDGQTQAARLVQLVCVMGPGDNEDLPEITIMIPGED